MCGPTISVGKRVKDRKFGGHVLVATISLKAFTYESKPRGAILCMCPMPPQPFDVSEPRFRDAFRDVVSPPKFPALRDQERSGSFFTDARLTTESGERYSLRPRDRFCDRATGAASSLFDRRPRNGGICAMPSICNAPTPPPHRTSFTGRPAQRRQMPDSPMRLNRSCCDGSPPPSDPSCG
jgi:hypothetical protein